MTTSRVLVEGKSSVCAINWRFMIMILIINIICLGQISVSYYCKHITHLRMHARTQACTHTYAHTRTYSRSLRRIFAVSAGD